MGLEWDPWRRVAERDRALAAYALDGGFRASAVLHACQAAEEALKAEWIRTTLSEPPRSHDIISLAESLNAPEDVLDSCRRLRPHYTTSRYPDAALGDPEKNYSEGIALALIADADRILQWCSPKLPK